MKKIMVMTLTLVLSFSLFTITADAGSAGTERGTPEIDGEDTGLDYGSTDDDCDVSDTYSFEDVSLDEIINGAIENYDFDFTELYERHLALREEMYQRHIELIEGMHDRHLELLEDIYSRQDSLMEGIYDGQSINIEDLYERYGNSYQAQAGLELPETFIEIYEMAVSREKENIAKYEQLLAGELSERERKTFEKLLDSSKERLQWLEDHYDDVLNGTWEAEFREQEIRMEESDR